MGKIVVVRSFFFCWVYYYQKLGTYYEICQFTETLLSGEIRKQIDTYIRDYCLVEKYTYL